MTWFSGKDAMLQAAIDSDDPSAVGAAIRTGASVNAKGRHGVSPLMYAVGHSRKSAYEALLNLGGETSLCDDEGINAMILAADVFKRDPEYLILALKAGGNPNSRLPDGDPIVMIFINDSDCDGIRTMRKFGADIDSRNRAGDPLIVYAGLVESWDVVWCLLDLGARYDYKGDLSYTLHDAFIDPDVTPPDSPLWRYKVKCWKFLREHGMVLVDLKPTS